MSYDVNAGGRDANYTSNMRALFVEYGVYPPDWHGRPRADVGAEISAGLRRMVRDREREGRAAFDARYNASNGWGHVDTAMQFLLVVWAGCTADLDTVEVWW